MESGRKIIVGGHFSDGQKNVGVFFPFATFFPTPPKMVGTFFPPWGLFSDPLKNGGDVFSTLGGFFLSAFFPGV